MSSGRWEWEIVVETVSVCVCVSEWESAYLFLHSNSLLNFVSLCCICNCVWLNPCAPAVPLFKSEHALPDGSRCIRFTLIARLRQCSKFQNLSAVVFVVVVVVWPWALIKSDAHTIRSSSNNNNMFQKVCRGSRKQTPHTHTHTYKPIETYVRVCW